MRATLLTLILPVVIVLFPSCSSPTELDTPRQRIVEEEQVKTTRVPAKSVEFIGAMDGQSMKDSVGYTEVAGLVCEYDSTTDRVWLSGEWILPSPYSANYPVQRIILDLKDIKLDGTEYVVQSNSAQANGRVWLLVPPVIPVEEEFEVGGSDVEMKVSFGYERVNRRIIGHLAGKAKVTREFDFGCAFKIYY